MKTDSATECYIIVTGSTQEQICTWGDLQSLVEAGELTGDTLIYREESQQWVPLSSLPEFADATWITPRTADPGDGEEIAELNREYEEAVKEARDRFDSYECLTTAARLALSLEKQDEAIEHYRRALELRPFDKRLANEIKRGLPPQVYRSFSLLDRPAPFWEDPVATVTYPLQTGWVVPAIAAAVLAVLSLVPFAQPLYWLLLMLLTVRVSCEARGRTVRSPDEILADPESFFTNWKPYARFLLFTAVLFLPFALLSELLLNIDGPRYWNIFPYIQDSPLLTVAIFIAGAALVPAVLMATADDNGAITDMHVVRRISRVMVSEDYEYLLLSAGMTLIALAWIGVRAMVSFVPVVGDLIAAAGALYSTMLIGYIAGRTRSRYAHILERENREHDNAPTRSAVHRP